MTGRRSPGPEREHRVDTTAVGLALVVATIHAGGWVAAEVAVEGIEPLTLAALRFTIAGALLLVVARWRRSPLGTDDWRSVAVVALIGVAVAHALFYHGLRLAPVADGVVLSTALTPALSVVLALALLGERLTRMGTLGVAISATGASLVVFEAGGGGGDRLVGDLLVVAGAAATALYTVIGRVALRSGTPLGVVASTTFIGGIALVPFALLEGTSGNAWSAEVWIAFLYLTLPSAGLSAVLYYALVRHSGAARASIVAYLVPVLVLGWSALIAGDPLTPARVVGAVLAVVGVRMVMTRSAPTRDEATPSAAHATLAGQPTGVPPDTRA